MIRKVVPALPKGGKHGSDIFTGGAVHYRVLHLEKETGGLLPHEEADGKGAADAAGRTPRSRYIQSIGI